jgi:UDP-N-acetylmuramoyl-L-alanyl-D-glutamate--2,6-diaminopimelate ligase
MIARDLVHRLSRVTASGPMDSEILSLTDSSRDAGPGKMFAAVRGTRADGHRFISDALAAGTSAILAETAPPADLDASVIWLHVPDSREALALLASAMAGDPWRGMAIAGVTGTNGKTTTAYLIHHIMKTAWHRAGLLGTILVDDGAASSVARHTTPGPVELAALLESMGGNGCRGLAMEVSSHGIHQKRVSAIGFDACVFTNLTQDHLDYHGTLENYFQAKASWFHALAADPMGKKPVAVINTDDSHGAELASALQGSMPVLRFGLNVHCDYRANNFRQSSRGMEFELAAKGRTFLVRAPLIGRFNVHNLLAAIAAANACGIRPREAISALANAPQVPGRMENVGNSGGSTVFVDYAHTPDALENACRTLRELEPRRLITVFGCGGDRDTGKRPLMGAVAARLSDACVVTSDNPRSEDPAAIIRGIEAGMGGKGHISIPDRAEAISHAVKNSLSGDIILIAGKGHETTQTFADQVIEFDDRKHASKALRDRAEFIAQNR